ncbi:MAG: bacteriohemerythrin [Planctomycetota bacterium]|jgi:hemerythrin-like metal-binding protein
MKFIWTNEYSVGVEELDRQHQHLFGLGNTIEDATLDKAKGYVMELYKYAREHFAAEEVHMAEIGFPALPEHRELHNRLCEDFNNTIENGFASEQEFDQFKLFLYGWLTNHVMKFDRRYFDFAKRSQAE